jgi:hypothetical protein
LAVADQIALNPLTMLASLLVPVGHRPFIDGKGRYNRRNGTTMRQQCQHQHHNSYRILQVVERCAHCLSKSLAAVVTYVASFIVRMDANSIIGRTPRTDDILGSEWQLL